jgi:DNA-binding GntR family transcriptional regulator
LREAFRILEHEGFIRVSNANKTLEVVDLSDDEMVELYEFREVVDGLAARLAARRGIAETDFDRLEGYVDEMAIRDPRDPRDGVARAMAHVAFHAAIAELSGNRMVINQIPMIRLTSQMLARRIAQLRSASPKATATLLDAGDADHRAVLAAIKNGAWADAESIARRHIRRTMGSELVRAARTGTPAALADPR